jgi:hypothetical protein
MVNYAEIESDHKAKELKLILGSMAKKDVTPPEF